MRNRTAIAAAAAFWSMAALLAATAVAPAIAEPAPLACDASLTRTFRPDAQTRVVLVKPYKAGEPLLLAEPATPYTARAASDLCLVKLIVGPGRPGPADASSTSPGIGIEIWLPAPARWNGRVHAIGGGGWVGGNAGSTTALVQDPRGPDIAGHEGAVTSTTDAGHSVVTAGSPSSGGDFAMNPDGTINRTLWEDFSVRAIHEQALKTKALAAAYYGRAPERSYWDGSSTGGRQALKLAQKHPADFDGIIANMPALHWTRLTVAAMYGQVAMQRDLGGVPLTEAQQDKVSRAAIAACDTVGDRHLGYITDYAACRYDPTKDRTVLCARDGGDGTADCVTKRQAAVVNKVWYGMTRDGSAPDPAIDNGWDKPLGGNRLWYGLPRGTSLYNAHYTNLYKVNAGFLNSGGPWTLAADQLALQLENARIAAPNFHNATANGADGWKALTYAQLAAAFDRGRTLQPQFAEIDTDDPDLTAFKARGGRMLAWQGLNDECIPVQGVIDYYDRVVARMGGLAKTQDFYRLYLVPGNGHGAYNGTANPAATPPALSGHQLYDRLVAWVEQGAAPARIEIAGTGTPPASAPICPYPQHAAYIGGAATDAASYRCATTARQSAGRH